MKKKIALLMMALLLAGYAAAEMQPPAGNGEEDILDILAPVLMSREVTDVLDEPSVQALVDAATAAGYAVPEEAAGNGAVRAYEFVLALCEADYGDYRAWSLSERHRFDQLMVSIGQLPRCFHLLPDAQEMAQADALELALAAISERFDLVCSPENVTAVFYTRRDGDEARGVWRFSCTVEGHGTYEVQASEGRILSCRERQGVSELDVLYETLCGERGAFFTWSLEEKSSFAAMLSPQLALARINSEHILSEHDLEAIARQGFCLPEDNCISRETAHTLAAEAVTGLYSLSDGWAESTETYYSFFRNGEGRLVWRVIFWKTGLADFPAGVVDMDAATGEILRAERSGATPETAIPYHDRL